MSTLRCVGFAKARLTVFALFLQHSGLRTRPVTLSVPVSLPTARDVLRRGGSAVDAALTTLLCLDVVNPQTSGLTGGMFMLVHRGRTGKTEALFARERAPSAATASMLIENFGEYDCLRKKV